MKTCELCNTRFSCDSDHSCWCMVKPLVTIKKELHDCVCPECLKEAHDQETRRTI